jgi:hypothetical protein
MGVKRIGTSSALALIQNESYFRRILKYIK